MPPTVPINHYPAKKIPETDGEKRERGPVPSSHADVFNGGKPACLERSNFLKVNDLDLQRNKEGVFEKQLSLTYTY